MNSLVGFPNFDPAKIFTFVYMNPSNSFNVHISDSTFKYFSSCGALLSNNHDLGISNGITALGK